MPQADPDRDLELAVVRLSWRLGALDDWRKDVDRRLATMGEAIEKMDRSEEIAREVAKRLRPSAQLTWYQKAGALLAGALVLSDAVKGLVS